MPGGRPLTRKREAAIAALLCTSTLEQAAQKAGVCERTLSTWLKEPDFAAAYRLARQRVVEQAIGILQQASIQAVATLVRNLNCGRHAVEVSAANSLLERSTAAIETFDILTRLEALEQQHALGRDAYAYRDAQTNGEANRGAGR
jgi:hypothetical protein